MRALLACLDVNDEDVVAVDDEEVGSASQHGGLSLESKRILGLCGDVVAAGEEPFLGLDQQRGVLDLPLDGVEVGWLAFPALVVGLEPSCVLAGTLPVRSLGRDVVQM